MYSTSDFEKLWSLYQTEGSPKGISINSYCATQGIPYTHFYDWLRRCQKPVVKVEIDGLPVDDSSSSVFHPSAGLSGSLSSPAPSAEGGILVSIQTHLAHARAKFKTAYNQGCEKARFFLEKIGALYQLEEDYRRLELSAQEIKKRRNDASTNKIVDELRNELFDLLSLPKDENSDLMQCALNYLHSFWKQLFAYRNNGEYTIDNLAAERAIRPLTVQRKNSLFFGSTKGALNSAVYNTFIETCKQVGVSFRDYFRAVLKELGSGREDYENFLPMTIGIKQNN